MPNPNLKVKDSACLNQDLAQPNKKLEEHYPATLFHRVSGDSYWGGNFKVY